MAQYLLFLTINDFKKELIPGIIKAALPWWNFKKQSVEQDRYIILSGECECSSAPNILAKHIFKDIWRANGEYCSIYFAYCKTLIIPRSAIERTQEYCFPSYKNPWTTIHSSDLDYEVPTK